MQKKSKIYFETDEIDEIADLLVEVDNNIYTKPINTISKIKKFPIPKQIEADLNLKTNDICFFVKHSSGDFIKFNEYPKEINKKFIYSRKLNYAGMYKTLYITIPIQILRELPKNTNTVQLMQIKGMAKNEWKITFLQTLS